MCMKKSLFVLGVAVAALASCTNEEVMDVAENRAIGFNAFVGNNTRALVTEVTKDNLSGFYVFGATSDDSNNWATSFNNTNVTGGTVDGSSTWTPAQEAYWQLGQAHRFAAYADGNNGSNANVTYTPADQKLTFASYTPDNTKDLIAAIPAEVASATVVADYNTAVALSFYHMLSQVKFTFSTDAADAYTLAITDIKITNAVKTATGTCTYAAGTPTIDWTTSTSTGEYTFDDITDVASTVSGNNHSTNCLVIPQDNTNSLNVTFTANLSDDNGVIGTGNFTAPLSYTAGTGPAGTINNTWTPGFIYNYTATITGEQLTDPENPDENLIPIKFTVTTVDAWDNASDSELTVSEVQAGA